LENLDIFPRIHIMYNSFTQTEKKVANFILENRDQVIYMSITELADKCNVGESSIFRFCKSLKFDGYQQFKIAMAHGMPVENKIIQLNKEILVDDSIEHVAAKVRTTNMNAIDETYNLLDYKNISEAVEALIKAEKIKFFGVGTSLLTAMEAQSKFIRITNRAECSMDSHFQIMAASLMTEKDVAIMISYSGSTKDTLDVAKEAKKAGAKVISITRFVKSPLTAYSDITLLCGANEGPLQGGSLAAKISQLYLLDVLYNEYFKRTYDISIRNKERTAKSAADKLL
jgi:DNA-binding MurR/RpiR family transcriptional regulator